MPAIDTTRTITLTDTGWRSIFTDGTKLYAFRWHSEALRMKTYTLPNTDDGAERTIGGRTSTVLQFDNINGGIAVAGHAATTTLYVCLGNAGDNAGVGMYNYSNNTLLHASAKPQDAEGETDYYNPFLTIVGAACNQTHLYTLAYSGGLAASANKRNLLQFRLRGHERPLYTGHYLIPNQSDTAISQNNVSGLAAHGNTLWYFHEHLAAEYQTLNIPDLTFS